MMPAIKPVAATPSANPAHTPASTVPMPVHTSQNFSPEKISSYFSAFDVIAHALANIFGVATHVTEGKESVPRAIGDVANEIAAAAGSASTSVFAGGAAKTAESVASIAATVAELAPVVDQLTATVTDTIHAVNAHTEQLATQATQLAAINSANNGVAPAGGEGA